MSGDQIVVTVTYVVAGHEVSRVVYTWTLSIPTPELINAAFLPGAGSPAFDDEVFDYILTLDVGTTSTNVNVTKEPGDLTTDITHVSAAAGGDVVICAACAHAVEVSNDTQFFMESSTG